MYVNADCLPSVMLPKPSDSQDDTHIKQPRVTSSPHDLISLFQSTEMGYLNLTSAQNISDQLVSPTIPSSSGSSCF